MPLFHFLHIIWWLVIDFFSFRILADITFAISSFLQGIFLSLRYSFSVLFDIEQDMNIGEERDTLGILLPRWVWLHSDRLKMPSFSPPMLDAIEARRHMLDTLLPITAFAEPLYHMRLSHAFIVEMNSIGCSLFLCHYWQFSLSFLFIKVRQHTSFQGKGLSRPSLETELYRRDMALASSSPDNVFFPRFSLLTFLHTARTHAISLQTGSALPRSLLTFTTDTPLLPLQREMEHY